MGYGSAHERHHVMRAQSHAPAPLAAAARAAAGSRPGVAETFAERPPGWPYDRIGPGRAARARTAR